jgi:type II secretory pathway component GspD/PulD (secretin)
VSREKTMRKMALAVVIFSVVSAGVSAAADPPIPQYPSAGADNQAPAAGANAGTVPATDNQAIYEGRVRKITVSRTPHFTNVEAVIEGKIGTYNSIKLDDPFRIVVDISGVDQGTAASEIPVGTRQVKTVRLSQQTNSLRMTVETPENRALPFLVTLEGNRLVLSVGGGQEEKVSSFDRPEEGKVPASAKPATSKPPVYISMDFTDVDLPVLIKFISEQTKKNFIFDERIQGKITIISPQRISLDEAYNVFLSVLHVKGFATVEQDHMIKIIPLRDIKQADLPTETGEDGAPGARFITRLIPLQYVNVTEILTLLTPLVSKEGLITSFPPSNTLIIIDSRANIDKVLRILAEIDREGTGTTMRIFTLKNASVAEIVKTLNLLYQETATPQAPAARGRARRPGIARGSAPKFIPDTRTNIMIVIAGPEMISDIEDLIAKLDIPTPENTGKINVYYLENAEAEEVAKVLASLTERRPGAPQAAAGRAPTIKGIIAAELEGGVKITADKATNSLIIIASLNDYQTLLDVIRKLDIRRRQVYVEAVVMEISLDKTRDLGAEFRGAFETGKDGAVLGGTNFNFQGNLNELLVSLAAGNPLLFTGTGLIAAGIAGNVKRQHQHPFHAAPSHPGQQGGGDHRRRKRPVHHQPVAGLDQPRQCDQHGRTAGRGHHPPDHPAHQRERLRQPGHLPGVLRGQGGGVHPGHQCGGTHDDETVRQDHRPRKERGNRGAGRDDAGDHQQHRNEDSDPGEHPAPREPLQVLVDQPVQDEPADLPDPAHHQEPRGYFGGDHRAQEENGRLHQRAQGGGGENLPRNG